MLEPNQENRVQLDTEGNSVFLLTGEEPATTKVK
jgi:hypothetical protein